MISLLAMMIPAMIINENLTIYPIVPPEAGQGWKLELFDLAQPIAPHYHKRQRQFILVANGSLKALYGTETPLTLHSGDHVCVDPGILHSLVPEGKVQFFSIDLPGFNYPEDVFFDAPQTPFKWSMENPESIPLLEEKHFGQRIDQGEYGVYELINGQATGGKWSAALLDIQDSPRHFHRIESEVFFVVNGTLAIDVDGIEHLLKVGSAIKIRPGSTHKLKSANSFPVRVLCFSFPAFDPADMHSVTSPKDILMDVSALSEKLCSHPIQGHLAYATQENFLGRVVDGYLPNASKIFLLTRKAAQQLCLVQCALNKQGLGLFIFDAFRPLRAVRDFSSWYHLPLASEYEKQRKTLHYPHLEKTDLPRLGYAPDGVSRHCFGHAVDLSLVDLRTGQLLDMGTIFDYFDSTSHHPATPPEIIGKEAYQNRQLLAQVMNAFGFISYPLEYWHFDYQEQEIDEPADIEINPSLMGINVR